MEEPIVAFSNRRGFYFRDNFRRLVVVCFLLLLLNTGFIGYMFYQVHMRLPGTPYVTTSGGDLIELYPAYDPDDAIMSRQVIINDNY